MKIEDSDKIVEELKKQGYEENLKLPFSYVRKAIQKAYAQAQKEEIESLQKIIKTGKERYWHDAVESVCLSRLSSLTGFSEKKRREK